jgi:hypothetical protein
MATIQEKRTVIENLDHLRTVAAMKDGQPPVEVNLLLDGGGFTRKYIQYSHSHNGRHWWLEEDGDEDGSYYTDRQLAEQTNIVKGIEKHALILVEA